MLSPFHMDNPASKIHFTTFYLILLPWTECLYPPSLSDVYVETLIPNVMVLGRRNKARTYLTGVGLLICIPLGINWQVGLLMVEPGERRKTPSTFETVSTWRHF